MRQVERYLDMVMAAARLAPGDAGRVRGELQEHLMGLVEDRANHGISAEEAWTMVQHEFGEPAALGAEIACARGRLRTWLKKTAPRLAVSVAVTILLTLTVRSYAVGIYRVAGNCVQPYAVKGNRVLVNRLASRYQAEDLVVYQSGGKALMGVIKAVRGADEYVIGRTHGPASEEVVTRQAIIGRVFLQTR